MRYSRHLYLNDATIKDLLNLILVLVIDNYWGWRRGMSMTDNGVREWWG
jgi:hypothetical protein